MPSSPSKTSHPLRWVLLILLVGGLCGGLGWWFGGGKVWTDGSAVRIAETQAEVREILWASPESIAIPDPSGGSMDQPSLSPDGNDLYFVRVGGDDHSYIYVSHHRGSAWTEPASVDEINSGADDRGPRVTADGRYLLFSSNRPGGFGGFDIWASARGPDGKWGEPFNLGPTVNTAYDEVSPDPTPDGKHLIFSTNRKAASRAQSETWRPRNRPNATSDYDLWIAELSEADAASVDAAAALAAPSSLPSTRPATAPTTAPLSLSSEEPLNAIPQDGLGATTTPAIPAALRFTGAAEIPNVNTAYVEGASCMSPAGDFLYLASDRPNGFGRFDLYRARVTPDWKFSVPENLGPSVNTAANEAAPMLSVGGYRLYFSSDRKTAGEPQLFTTDSREVFLQRQLRPLPHVSMSWWVMIASLALLIPLLMLLRGFGENRLSILQRCLLLSVLIHIVISFCLSFVSVSQQVRQYVKQETGVDIGLNLPKELAVGLSIRKDDTSDAPRPAPAPSLPQVSAPLEAPPLPAGPAHLDIHAAPAVPGGVAVDVAIPHLASPTLNVKPTVLAPQPIAPPAPPVAINPVMPQAPLAQADPVLPPAPPAPQPLQAAPNQVAMIAPPLPGPANDPAVKPHAIPQPPAAPAPSPVHPAVSPSPRPLSAPPVASTPAPSPQVAIARHDQPIAPEVAPAESIKPAAPTEISRAHDTDAAPTHPDLSNSPAMAAPTKAVDIAPLTLSPAVGLPKPGLGAGDVGGAAVRPDVLALARSVPGPEILLAPSTARRPPDTEPALASNDPATAAPQTLAPATRPSDSGASVDPTESARVALTVGPAHVGPQPTPNSALVAPGGLALAPPSAPSVDSHIAPTAADHVSPAPAIALAPSAGPTNNGATNGTGTAGPAPDELARATDVPAITRTRAPTGADPAGTDAGVARAPAMIVPGGVSPAVADSGHQSLISVPGEPTPLQQRAPQPTPGAMASTETTGLAGAFAGPQVALPAARGTGAGVVGGPATDEPARVATDVVPQSPRSLLAADIPNSHPRDINLPPLTAASASGSAPAMPNAHKSDNPADALASGAPRPATGRLAPMSFDPASPPAKPQVAIAPLPGILGPSQINAPTSPLTQRSPELRKPLIEKLGGTDASENAVDHALGYLSRQQEPDGRWTFVMDESHPGKRGKSPHDMAYTGLAVLSFLARDHTPDKPGPYREAVASGLQYLLDTQERDGDLRGPPDQRGGGSGRGNMYDHAIATLALAEAAMMTQDQRCAEAVSRAAQFIVDAQNKQNGGWRYVPEELGDTSVFGWEIMALHSAELLGFQTPEITRQRALRFRDLVTGGRRHMLAAYQPGGGVTPPMTAEMVFCRMLLGQKLEDADVQEATDFLAQDAPDLNSPDLYYWYYASLCMMQMQSKSWKSWNAATRDGLVHLQHRGGFTDGSWTVVSHRSERGGYIFSTAIATLTLEVYYRYNHLLGDAPTNTVNQTNAGPTDPATATRADGDDSAVPTYRRTKKPRLDAN